MTKQLLLASVFMITTLCAFAQNNTTDEGVEINGIIWATRNVDAPGTFADNPEDAGMFYQWNRRRGWSSTTPGLGVPVPGWIIFGIGGEEWEREEDPCPPGWRIPTETEFRQLLNVSYGWEDDNRGEWASNWNDTGVNGRVFGTAPNQIFLPAVGWRFGFDGTLEKVDFWGSYWSSTPNSGGSVLALSFDSMFSFITTLFSGGKTSGNSIRCVKAENHTSINNPSTETNRTIVAFYNVLGQRLGQAPQRGIYIVVFDNGTAERRMR